MPALRYHFTREIQLTSSRKSPRGILAGDLISRNEGILWRSPFYPASMRARAHRSWRRVCNPAIKVERDESCSLTHRGVISRCHNRLLVRQLIYERESTNRASPSCFGHDLSRPWLFLLTNLPGIATSVKYQTVVELESTWHTYIHIRTCTLTRIHQIHTRASICASYKMRARARNDGGARVDRQYGGGPGPCLAAFSVYGPIASRLGGREKINSPRRQTG